MKNKIFVFLLWIICSTGFSQPTYLKRLTFNAMSAYLHPEDSILDLLDVSESPDGNTYIHISDTRGATTIYKINLQGNVLFGLPVGNNGGMNRTDGNSMHATPDNGCIHAENYVSWSTTWNYFSFIVKTDSYGATEWTTMLPRYIPSPGVYYQVNYDIAILPNGGFACLADDSTYILNSNGVLVRTLNYSGAGEIFSFPNGDFYIHCPSFKGRTDSLGNPIWTISGTVLHHDTTLYKLAGNTMSKLDGMTGGIISSATFTHSGLTSFLMMSDGGWCGYNSSTIQRFDSNGNLKWTEIVNLPRYGMNRIGEQSDGTIITGGTYLCKRCIYYEHDFSAFIGTIDSSGHGIIDSTTQICPGDANADRLVDFGDVVYIALAQGSSGPNRIDSSLYNFNDNPYCGTYNYLDLSVDFPGKFGTGINHKHSDVYTDGVIDSLDIQELATKISFSQFTPQYRLKSQETQSTTLPYFSVVPNRDTALAGDTIRVYFILGDNGIIVDSIFGLSFSLNPVLSQYWIMGNVISSGVFDSDLGTSSDLRYGIYSPGINLLFARRDLQNAYSVQDTIGYFDFKIYDTLSYHTNIYFPVGAFKAITAGGFPVDFQFNSVPIYARSIIASLPELSFNRITCSPNPAKEFITLNQLPKEDLTIQLFDAQGRLCFSGNTEFNHDYSIDLKSLQSGIFLLSIFKMDGTSISRKFIKE